MTGAPRSHWTRATLVAVFFTVLHTWPLATAPATLSLNHNGDAMLNEWIVAWVQHQLPRDPLRLFQANIFHPAPDVLAFSEPLIVPALLGAPVRLAGGSPVLVYNILLLFGMTLTMLSMYALVRAWTGDEMAALVAGAAFAFNAHTLMRLAHLQALHAYGLPLALLAADRLITSAKLRDALWLAFWMIVMAFTSGHFVIFASFIVAIALLVRVREWMPVWRQVLPRFAVAVLVSAVMVAPIYVHYRRVAVEQHMVRSLENAGEYSADLRDYVASASRLHASLLRKVSGEPANAFFPGITVLGLAACAFAFIGRDTRSRIAVLGAIALTGIVMSLGPRTPLYGWVYAAFPPLSAIRVAARFGNLLLLATAGLAGYGLWQLRRRLQPRGATAAGVAALALVSIEAIASPMTFQEFRGVPGLYALVAQAPAPVVLVEQPFYPPQAVFENAEYVLNSTAHWRPLMNGYSGYIPAKYRELTHTFWFFPRHHAIDAMQREGVTHVMVHAQRFGDQAAEIIRLCDADPRLEKLGVGREGLTLYRLAAR